LVATDVAARGLGKYCTETKGLNYIVWSHLTTWGSPVAFSWTWLVFCCNTVF